MNQFSLFAFIPRRQKYSTSLSRLSCLDTVNSFIFSFILSVSYQRYKFVYLYGIWESARRPVSHITGLIERPNE